MKVIVVATVALVIGFLVGVLLSGLVNPPFEAEHPPGLPRTIQKN